MAAEHLTRWGIGKISLWDPDIVKDLNINRSAFFTFEDARVGRGKAEVIAERLPGIALHRALSVAYSDRDVRLSTELPTLLDADVILSLVDDARPRHFLNRLAYSHYIPVLDAGNVIRSTAESDPESESASVENGGVRVSTLLPGNACLWCAGQLDPRKLSLAFRSDADKAADRARGYVEGLGPEHAPSVMPLNVLTAALLEIRLQDLLFGLSRRAVTETYFDLLGGTLDELPRRRGDNCRQCLPFEGLGDEAELPFADS